MKKEEKNEGKLEKKAEEGKQKTKKKNKKKSRDKQTKQDSSASEGKLESGEMLIESNHENSLTQVPRSTREYLDEAFF